MVHNRHKKATVTWRITNQSNNHAVCYVGVIHIIGLDTSWRWVVLVDYVKTCHMSTLGPEKHTAICSVTEERLKDKDNKILRKILNIWMFWETH